MFTQFKNYDTVVRHFKAYSLIWILATGLLTGFINYKCIDMVKTMQNKIYILYNGKVLEALAAERKTNLPVELRDHIKTFHQYFFSLSPDEKAIQANVTKALYLADESAKKQYDNLKEAGYYNNLISANLSQEIEVDSTILDINKTPYTFKCYATEKLIRASGTFNRKLVTEGQVRDIKIQTDNNPHGFLIQNWEILKNEDEQPKDAQP